MDLSNKASRHNDKADSQNRIISHKFDPKDHSLVSAADIHVNAHDKHVGEGDEIRQALREIITVIISLRAGPTTLRFLLIKLFISLKKRAYGHF
jgi:hypothetical protein